MAGVNDCIDACSLEENGSGLLQVRLAPGGGLECSNGLRIAPDSTFQPHYALDGGGPFLTPDPINTGILGPVVAAPGGTPVTSVMSGLVHVSPAGGTYAAELSAHSNMFLVAPDGVASQCSLELLGSLDAVNYFPLHNQSYFTATGSPTAPNTWQKWFHVVYPPSSSFTPVFVINYLHNAGDDADFLKATYFEYQIRYHRLS